MDYNSEIYRVVYALLDPRNSLPFYVGQTSKNPAQRRLFEHLVSGMLYNPLSHDQDSKECYIYCLLKDGLEPTLHILEEAYCDHRTIIRKELGFMRSMADNYSLSNLQVRPQDERTYTPCNEWPGDWPTDIADYDVYAYLSRRYWECFHRDHELPLCPQYSSRGVPVYIPDKLADWEKGYNDPGSNLCPECEGYLKKSSGPWGYFWGCTNYPECRHTEKLNDF